MYRPVLGEVCGDLPIEQRRIASSESDSGSQ